MIDQYFTYYSRKSSEKLHLQGTQYKEKAIHFFRIMTDAEIIKFKYILRIHAFENEIKFEAIKDFFYSLVGSETIIQNETSEIEFDLPIEKIDNFLEFKFSRLRRFDSLYITGSCNLKNFDYGSLRYGSNIKKYCDITLFAHEPQYQYADFQIIFPTNDINVVINESKRIEKQLMVSFKKECFHAYRWNGKKYKNINLTTAST